MRAFEYKTIFEPLEHEATTAGVLVFKQTRTDYARPLVEPLVQRFDSGALSKLGASGWELVSTQAIWGTLYPGGNSQEQGIVSSHQFLKGYLLFLKREIQAAGHV